jgi:hypothetical protein
MRREYIEKRGSIDGSLRRWLIRMKSGKGLPASRQFLPSCAEWISHCLESCDDLTAPTYRTLQSEAWSRLVSWPYATSWLISSLPFDSSSRWTAPTGVHDAIRKSGSKCPVERGRRSRDTRKQLRLLKNYFSGLQPAYRERGIHSLRTVCQGETGIGGTFSTASTVFGTSFHAPRLLDF